MTTNAAGIAAATLAVGPLAEGQSSVTQACISGGGSCAPFAVLGSIGVVAQIPNVNRILKKNDIDVEVMTAGEYKRSVSIFGEITPAGREHFQGKLEQTHEAFKRLITELRPGVAISEVGNGDVWLARDALALGLVDELCVSDDYLFRQRGKAAIYLIKSHEPKPLLRQLLDRLGALARLGLQVFSTR